jgi:hypothetical protein
MHKIIAVATLLTAGMALLAPAWASDSEALLGNWKLVSWQVVADSETENPFGLNPKGYLLLTRGGRAMVITTAESRNPGSSVDEMAALSRSMLAYTGKYRIEGDDFITTIDVSWNEIWNGTEQRRHFRIEGDRLLIETAPAPSIVHPGKTDFRRLVWEREN